jgi:hypothetical protein
MSTGAMILIAITAVLVLDVLIAIWMHERANRIESGELKSTNTDPASSRRAANLILINAPIIWIVTALICFGVIPTGIDTVKF